MYLKSINLAGFKTFADKTEISLSPGVLVLVGPNGCGKSNLIEAIRWVIGGSSARQVRGMDVGHVIFNGTDVRKPLSRASVELVLDNSDGASIERIARYKEISVRREVSRDGVSNYYLNGTLCRRSDITDIFVGTGLGQGGYAAIGQGRIASLAEGNTETLRGLIEEASGVSRYRIKRRQTENKIAHTHEHLEQVTEEQRHSAERVKELKAQTKHAEKYQRYTAQRDKLSGQQLALQARVALREQERVSAERAQLVQQQQGLETELETLKQQENTLLQQFEAERGKLDAAQVTFYEQKSVIKGVDERLTQRKQQQATCERELQGLKTDRDKQSAEMARCETALGTYGAEFEKFDGEYAACTAQTEELRAVSEKCDADVDAHDRALEACKEQVHSARIALMESQQGLQRVINDLNACHEKLKDLDREQERLTVFARSAKDDQPQAQDYARLEALGAQLRERTENAQSAFNETQARCHALDEEYAQLQEHKVRNALLTPVSHDKTLQAYLGLLRSEQLPMLVEHLSVDERWVKAVCLVLAQHLHAYMLEDVNALSKHLEDLPFIEHAWGFVHATDYIAPKIAPPEGGHWLSELVKSDGAPTNVLKGLCRDVVAVENTQSAFNMRAQLEGHQSVVSQEGVWLGHGFIRVASDARDNTQAIRDINTQFAQVGEQLQQARTQLARQRVTLEECQVAEKEHSDQLLAASVEEGRRSEQQKLLLNQKERMQEIADERDRLAERITSLEREREEVERRAGTAHDDEEKQLSERVREQQVERDKARNAARVAHADLEKSLNRAHELKLKQVDLRNTEKSDQQGLKYLTQQHEQNTRRAEELEAQLRDHQAVVAQLEEQISPQRDSQKQSEASLKSGQDILADIQTQQHQNRERARQTQQEYDNNKQAVADLDLSLGKLRINVEHAYKNIKTHHQDIDALMQELSETDSEANFERQKLSLETRIENLGPVNLAATQELATVSEKSDKMEKQKADVLASLDNLEKVMQRIDTDARKSFFNTVKRLNESLSHYFKKLFQGGDATLKVSGNDPWSGDVSFYARPSGKRNQMVQQLSGGEKTLLSIALVFAIFEFNRAPFCLLDEVDAALDDANILRFQKLLVQVSKNVQILCVSHNQLTMEHADYLLGVSVDDTGVSQVLGVDLEQHMSSQQNTV